MSRSREVIPSIRRPRRAALLLLLSAELVLAGFWRLPWTLAPIQTPFDYGTGHVTVVSERWRRFGALRHHFLPVMSIDPDLPEWPYRTPGSQEYASVPPLAFVLHYGATRLAPGAEPVLLGKLLAQLLIAGSVLAAAALLMEVFGAWATLAALSFVIWSVPSLLWLANGYFALNVGLAVQFVLVAWCAVSASRVSDRGGGSHAAIPFAVGAALAFLGGFADYLPLVANAIAAAGFLGLAAVGWSRPAGRSRLLASAVGVVIGSLAALAATAILYGREMGMARYWDAISLRVSQRSGYAPVAEHLDVIRRQMLTAWPPAVLVVLIVMLCVVVAWCGVSFAHTARPFRQSSSRRRAFGARDRLRAVALLSLPRGELRAASLVVRGHVDDRMGDHHLRLRLHRRPPGAWRIAGLRGDPVPDRRGGRALPRSSRGRRSSRKRRPHVSRARNGPAARRVAADCDRRRQARPVRGLSVRDRVSQAARAVARRGRRRAIACRGRAV